MYNLPKYISDENFNKDGLDELLKSGTLNNNVDSAGNFNISFDEITQESNLGDYLVGVPIEKLHKSKSKLKPFFQLILRNLPMWKESIKKTMLTHYIQK